MKLTLFRKRMIYLLLICQFVIIGTAIFLWIASGYDFQQLKEIFFLIIPLFSANITLAVHFYLNKLDKTETKDYEVPGPLKVIGIGGSIVYAVYMLAILFSYVNVSSDSDSFTQMKELIGWGEILFGVYIGYIMAAIFKSGS